MREVVGTLNLSLVSANDCVGRNIYILKARLKTEMFDFTTHYYKAQKVGNMWTFVDLDVSNNVLGATHKWMSDRVSLKDLLIWGFNYFESYNPECFGLVGIYEFESLREFSTWLFKELNGKEY